MPRSTLGVCVALFPLIFRVALIFLFLFMTHDAQQQLVHFRPAHPRLPPFPSPPFGYGLPPLIRFASILSMSSTAAYNTIWACLSQSLGHFLSLFFIFFHAIVSRVSCTYGANGNGELVGAVGKPRREYSRLSHPSLKRTTSLQHSTVWRLVALETRTGIHTQRAFFYTVKHAMAMAIGSLGGDAPQRHQSKHQHYPHAAHYRKQRKQREVAK